MPPSSSSSSSSSPSQSWSDPHGLQRQRRPFQLSPPPSSAAARTSSSGSGVHSGGKIGDGERREAHKSGGENVRVARGLLGKEGGEFSSTVVTTTKISEAAATSSSAVDSASADRPSWRRSLTPPVSPWPIRHWWAQG